MKGGCKQVQQGTDSLSIFSTLPPSLEVPPQPGRGQRTRRWGMPPGSARRVLLLVRCGYNVWLAGLLPIALDECGPVDCHEQLTKLSKPLMAEVTFEFHFDARHAVPHDATNRIAPLGKFDPPGALVVWVIVALQIAQLLELP